MKTLAYVVLFIFSAVGAQAQAVADSMTCQQAISYYEQNGRISKLAGNSAIPIYDGAPASQRSELGCPTVPIMFKTTDNRRCPVAYKCKPRGQGGGR